MKLKKIVIIVGLMLSLIACFTGCKDKKENEKKENKKQEKVKEKKEKKEVEDNENIKSNAFIVTYTTTKEKKEKLRTCMCFEEIKDLVKENKKILKTMNIQDVHVIGNDVNYEEEIDASELFRNCNYLEEVDFSLMSTERFTKIDNMFTDCISLEKIYVSDKWDISNAKISKSMFKNCISLKGDKKFNAKYISSKYATYKDGYLIYKNN